MSCRRCFDQTKSELEARQWQPRLTWNAEAVEWPCWNALAKRPLDHTCRDGALWTSCKQGFTSTSAGRGIRVWECDCAEFVFRCCTFETMTAFRPFFHLSNESWKFLFFITMDAKSLNTGRRRIWEIWLKTPQARKSFMPVTSGHLVQLVPGDSCWPHRELSRILTFFKMLEMLCRLHNAVSSEVLSSEVGVGEPSVTVRT